MKTNNNKSTIPFKEIAMQVIHNKLLDSAVRIRFGDLERGELFYSFVEGDKEKGLRLFVKMFDAYDMEDEEFNINTVPVRWDAGLCHVNTEDDEMVFPVNTLEVK